MRAITRSRYGGPEVLAVSTVPDPDTAPDRILIRVEAASVNRSDWEGLNGSPLYARIGNGLFRPRVASLGSDVAGEVVAVGSDVDDWEIGDRVYGDLMWHGGGCFAELVSSRHDAPLAHRPDGLSAVDAAAIPQAGALAAQALEEPGAVTSGDRVLVIGGGGGGGSFAIQIALAAGAVVHGVDTAAKGAFMRSLGATHTFDFATEDFTRSGERYDRILDFPGRRSLRAIRRVLADDGVYWMVGGSVPKLISVLVVGGIRTRRTNQSIGILMGRPTADRIAAIGELVARGVMSASVEQTYALDETPQALERLGSNLAQGKLVIAVT